MSRSSLNRPSSVSFEFQTATLILSHGETVVWSRWDVGGWVQAPLDSDRQHPSEHRQLFWIRDVPTGAMLFAGRVSDPRG